MSRKWVAVGFILWGVLLASCAPLKTATPPAPTETVTPIPITATPDPCSAQNIVNEVKRVHDVMREFDDLNYVANITPQAQLLDIIQKMQTVRRKMEDLAVPSCTQKMRANGVDYMNGVIDYLAMFASGATKDQVTQAIKNGQDLRVAYEAELARLIGATYVPPPTWTPVPTLAGVAQGVTATNNSGQVLNLRSAASTTAQVIGTFPSGDVAQVMYRDATSQWLLVLYNGSYGWVAAQLVTLNVPLQSIPTPPPQ